MKSKLFKGMLPFLVDVEAHAKIHIGYIDSLNGLDLLGTGKWLHELNTFRSVDPAGSQWMTIGLVPPLGADPTLRDDHEDELDPMELIAGITGRAYMFYVQFNEKILPGSVRDEAMRDRVRALEDKEGRPLYKNEYCQVRDIVELELLKDAFIRRTIVPVMITNDSQMIVFSSSAKRIDDAGALLRRAIPFLKTKQLHTQNGHGSLLRAVIQKPYYWGDDLDHDPDEVPGYGVEAFNNAKLVGNDKKTISIKDMDLYSRDVQNIVGEGYEPIEMKMQWFEDEDQATDSVPTATFTLTEKGVYKGIALGDFKVDGEADERDDSATALITADWLLVHDIYGKVVNSIIAACGGPMEGIEFSNETLDQEQTDTGDLDDLYDEAVKTVVENNKASISYLQRKLVIGYNRAARLVETMEQNGVVSTPDHTGRREVLQGAPGEGSGDDEI